MNDYCDYIVVRCDCDRGIKEPDCTEVRCGEPAVMKVRGVWRCLKHGEETQAFWDRYDAYKAGKN